MENNGEQLNSFQNCHTFNYDKKKKKKTSSDATHGFEYDFY